MAVDHKVGIQGPSARRQRCTMKTVIAAVLALLVGLALGGWGPRLDLRQARDQIKDLESKLRKRGASAGKMEAVKSMLQVKDDEMSAARARARKNTPKNPVAFRSALATNNVSTPTEPDHAKGTNSSEKFSEHLQKEMDLWNTRVEMSRNSFITNLGLNAQQTAVFDGMMAVMNSQLEQGIRQWADTLKQKDSMTGEDSIKMMNELSGVLAKTYGEMDQAMPAGWRDKAGSGFELMNFIDPAVALPLTDVQDKLQRRQGKRSQGNGGNVNIEVQ